MSPYDILKSTFCIYCQEEKNSPEDLQRHILAKHRDTYAYWAVIEARKVRTEVARLRASLEQKQPARKIRKHD